MYERYLPLLVLAGLLLLGTSWWWQRRRHAAFPYRQVEALFTPAEQAFLAVHAVVELNDRSHLQRHRQQRDRFVRAVCEAAQLRLVEIPAAARYSASAVREAVFGGRRPRNRAAAPSVALAPECPDCQAPMVRRRARSGRHQGREFWACSDYPDCRALRDIDD